MQKEDEVKTNKSGKFRSLFVLAIYFQHSDLSASFAIWRPAIIVNLADLGTNPFKENKVNLTSF